MVGLEDTREQAYERLQNLPLREDMNARLAEIRLSSRVRKCDLEEALRIVQFLTLADVWEVTSARTTSALLSDLEDRAAEVKAIRERGMKG